MEIKSIKRIAIALIAVLFIASCNCNKKAVANEDNIKVDESKYDGYTKVILDQHILDGCNWMFEIEEASEEGGAKYLMPVENFPEASAVAGKYYLKFTPVDVMTTCMMGKPIRVDDMLPRK